jgi:ParB family transcriptional regulator, chromosome partitioning protein
MEFDSVIDIPLDRLQVSRMQVRVRDIEKDLDELVDNIRTHGQLEPIVVARVPNSDRYEIITGQRRFLAHQRLGRRTILAGVLRGSVDDATAKALSLSENLIRRDLNPKDLIDACTALYRKYGDAKSVSEELGIPYRRVIANIKYDRLMPALRQLVDSGEVELGTALQVQTAVDGAEDRVDVARLATNLGRVSRAQQRRLLKGASVAELSDIANHGPTDQRRRVVQIVVTLSAAAHGELRMWAKHRGMSQDEAAREIIEGFLAASDPAELDEADDGALPLPMTGGRLVAGNGRGTRRTV